MRKVTCIFLLGFAITAGIFNVVYAREPYLEWFKDKYGTGGTQLDDCITCHISSNPDGNGGRNPYGDDFEKEGSNREAFGAVELWDSDDDGFSNKAEIENRTFPGDPRSVPGGDNGCFITTAFPFVSPQRTAIGPALPSLVRRTDFVEIALLILLPSVIAITLVLRRKRGSGF